MGRCRGRANLKIAFIGCCAMAVGVAEYFFIRGPQSLYLGAFFAGPPSIISINNYFPKQMVWLSESLPTAVHAFAFSLFTALALGLKKPQIIIACVSWAVIDSTFEALQYSTECPASFLLKHQEVYKFFCSYIEPGVFDWQDIFSIFLGVILAYLLLRFFLPNDGDANEY